MEKHYIVRESSGRVLYEDNDGHKAEIVFSEAPKTSKADHIYWEASHLEQWMTWRTEHSWEQQQKKRWG